jgi:hypothetical protein
MEHGLLHTFVPIWIRYCKAIFVPDTGCAYFALRVSMEKGLAVVSNWKKVIVVNWSVLMNRVV